MASRRIRHLAVVAEHTTEFAESSRSAGPTPTTKGRAERSWIQLLDSGLIDVLDVLEPLLDSVLEERPRTVVVDMSAVGHMSSTTIAALLWIRRRCSDRGVEMLLGHLSRSNRDALRRVGLLRVLVLDPTEESGRSRGLGFPSRQG